MNTTIVPTDFFNRPADVVARELLGMHLVRRNECDELCYTITETEAYLGREDKACHAHRGLTPRTRVMFGPPGHFYVYLVYGMHHMLNIVCMPEGEPHAVLLRGTSEVSGPGRLAKALGIDVRLNGAPVAQTSGLYIARPTSPPARPTDIAQTPRIGVDYADEWARKPLRFVLNHS